MRRALVLGCVLAATGCESHRAAPTERDAAAATRPGTDAPTDPQLRVTPGTRPDADAPTGHATPASPPDAAAPVDSAVDAAAEAGAGAEGSFSCRPDGSVLGPRLLTRFVEERGGPLSVSVVDAEDSGTMHYAEQIRLAVPGAAPWLRRADLEHGFLPPLLRRRARAGPGRDLLLGWSSSGGGGQTMVAWLVAEAGARRLIDELVVQDRRGDALLLLRRRDGALQVGVPAPRDPGRSVDGPWLQTHDIRLPIERWDELSFETFEPDAVEAFCPPFGLASARPERVAWLSVASTGFVTTTR